jgi:glyoxylase-like metal-dependent hydrolase (beta-lactamase superfamily II)
MAEQKTPGQRSRGWTEVLRWLPISMPGLGHVNCYALVDDEGAALVDPGLPGSPTWKALQDRLKQAGLRSKHVHTIVVTHSHPDHFGGATRFVKETGAKVIAHRNFRFGLPQNKPEVSVEDLEAQRGPANAEEPAERGPRLET